MLVCCKLKLCDVWPVSICLSSWKNLEKPSDVVSVRICKQRDIVFYSRPWSQRNSNDISLWCSNDIPFSFSGAYRTFNGLVFDFVMGWWAMRIIECRMIALILQLRWCISWSFFNSGYSCFVWLHRGKCFPVLGEHMIDVLMEGNVVGKCHFGTVNTWVIPSLIDSKNQSHNFNNSVYFIHY